MIDPRFAIGIHEGAHIVAGHCLGLTPKRIRISTGDGHELGGALFAPAPHNAFTDAIVAAAGELAEFKEFGRLVNMSGATKPRYGDPASFGEPSSDRPGVTDAVYVGAVSPEDRVRAARVASQIIEAYWSDIRSLAKQLTRFGVVTDFSQLRYIGRWTRTNPQE